MCDFFESSIWSTLIFQFYSHRRKLKSLIHQLLSPDATENTLTHHFSARKGTTTFHFGSLPIVEWEISRFVKWGMKFYLLATSLPRFKFPRPFPCGAVRNNFYQTPFPKSTQLKRIVTRAVFFNAILLENVCMSSETGPHIFISKNACYIWNL